ncbi:Eukaryotic translation initiation factor 4E [Rhizoctonia solani]|uniref:Eukaryotic translation initiation factor 4E n=1 Tax=Rhizoctonia solani TaxID=456999 RepID=A0A8H7M9I0_9AGAM|nr:Eukaryotic translation initiation factor 4E [Rhizoctonia solani]
MKCALSFQTPKLSTSSIPSTLHGPFGLISKHQGQNPPSDPSDLSAPNPGGVPPTPGALSWMDDIKRLIKFDSVEEFWGLYNNIIAPSKLPPKANYYLFKDDILPAWEDAANKDGGNGMLAAIGETFDPALSKAADPNSTTPSNLLDHGYETEEAIKQRIEHIGRHFKTEVLGFHESAKIGGPLATEVEFASHKDSEKKGSKGKKWVI